MTPEEADAHLFALGITDDARSLRVMILGNTDANTTLLIVTRLDRLGAALWWPEDHLADPEIRVDYLVAIPQDNATYKASALADAVLTPGGRYLILIDDVADGSAGIELTDVRQIGDSQIRAIGWKRRVHGEVV